MTPEELTPGTVLKWLRTQAKKYSDTAARYAETANKFYQVADMLEQTVDPGGKPLAQPAASAVPAPHTRLFDKATGKAAS